ncbi:futalosine hydrolase [Halosquirtibacter laminarini]|uniref:Futalosine hydrolase n=1 Tax=Halosquirtibacter laminarini TaxID=3374600 RepID=A0AC61NBX4_9BACT|nr:futalosine hydrolase [Prolixibacteraceae bacterium]
MNKKSKHILLVAATKFEIERITQKFTHSETPNHFRDSRYPNTLFETLITGVGIHPTIYQLTKRVMSPCEPVDLIINLGIAGAFDMNRALGETVQVVKQQFVDWGVADSKGFLSVFDLQFQNPNQPPFSEATITNPLTIEMKNLSQVSSITSNTSHGSIESIQIAKTQAHADIESMEGAAVAFVAKQESIDYIEMRTISNHVEPRDRSKWNIPLALDNLCTSFFQLLEHYKQI